MNRKQRILMVVILTAFTGSSAFVADVEQCTLFCDSFMTVEPGHQISFWAVYIHNTTKPGKVRLYVIGSSAPTWMSDIQEFDSPGYGQAVNISFIKKYTVPADSPNNKEFCFQLVNKNLPAYCGQAICTYVFRNDININKPKLDIHTKDVKVKVQGVDLIVALSNFGSYKAVVKNRGTVKSGECWLHILCVSAQGVEKTKSKRISKLDPGATEIVDFSDIVSANGKVKACVDTHNEVAEYNEDNNCASKEYD